MTKMILHIPHSSSSIPDNFRDQIVLSDEELSDELRAMTDWFTDELFVLPETVIVLFPMSRLIVDVERFSDDDKEPMSKVGMGMIYTRTSSGKELRRKLHPDEKMGLAFHYEAHHRTLLREVENELKKYGRALIVDCHSFPSHSLPCDRDQSMPRPEFCIGTDSFHTPYELIKMTEQRLIKMDYSVRIDQPYDGSIVPTEFYHKDRRVVSIMVEVNRNLYMDEITGTKKSTFVYIKEQIQSLLISLKKCRCKYSTY